MSESQSAWSTFGSKTIYDSRWVRLGLGGWCPSLLTWNAADRLRLYWPLRPERDSPKVFRWSRNRVYGPVGALDTSHLVDVEAPNGERWEYHVVHLPPIAVALIVNDADAVLMLWRYRFATAQWGYELLGGLVDEGEEAERTAAREAAEESGWAPVGPGERLISFEPLPLNCFHRLRPPATGDGERDPQTGSRVLSPARTSSQTSFPTGPRNRRRPRYPSDPRPRVHAELASS